jgi:polar amino acid transport system permease protein
VAQRGRPGALIRGRAARMKSGAGIAAANRRLRFTWLDAVLLAAVAFAVGYVAWRAGSVLHYRWDWSRIPPYLLRFDEAKQRWVTNLLIDGLLTTIRVSLWSAVLAAVFGTVMGLARVSKRLLPRLIGTTYVELIRNIPPLVFVFVFYFFITSQITPLLGVDAFVRGASPSALAVIEVLFGPPRFLPAVLSAILCLALFEGAYVTEIIRAGVTSIEKGQWEAAAAIGLSRLRTLRLVVLPQAIQRVTPPLANQFISLVKDSSIVSLISIQELTFLGNEVAASTSRVFEVWIVVAAMYFLLCWCLSLGFERLERRMNRGRR